MSPHFKVTGPEALLAIAAFAADAEDFSWREAEHAHLSVEVQRVMTRPGVYRYHCTIQPDVKAALN